MNGAGSPSLYRQFTASVTLTIPYVKDKHARCGGKKRERGEKRLPRWLRKNQKDLMLLDITRLRYRHFTEPTRLIESAPPPGAESSVLLAGPPSLHFFLQRNTSHLTHGSPKRTNLRAHTKLEHITTVWLPHGYTDEAICALVVFVWVSVCLIERRDL